MLQMYLSLSRGRGKERHGADLAMQRPARGAADSEGSEGRRDGSGLNARKELLCQARRARKQTDLTERPPRNHRGASSHQARRHLRPPMLPAAIAAGAAAAAAGGASNLGYRSVPE